jgi:multisubunit Na+/H+ antiporter MnhE subunit
MSYLCYLYLFGSSLPPVVCRRADVLFMLLVFVWLVFTYSCLREGACLIYVISVCLVRLYLQLFVEGLMSYLCYLCLFGSSLPPVVCRRADVLFMLLVFVWLVFTSSCLREGACLIYVICVCLVRLYLQLFVEGLMPYLCY